MFIYLVSISVNISHSQSDFSHYQIRSQYQSEVNTYIHATCIHVTNLDYNNHGNYILILEPSVLTWNLAILTILN